MAKKTALGKTPAEIARAIVDEPEPPQAGEPPTPAAGTVQTSRGYVTSEGVEKVRVSLHLTKAQRRRLKDLAYDAGKDVTEYVVEKLGL